VASIQKTLDDLMKLDGALCSMLVDYTTGMVMGQSGHADDLELIAAGNTEVVRAKMNVMQALGKRDVIEDILITLGTQYHILAPSARHEGLFIYLLLDRQRSNLALARRWVHDADKGLMLT